MRPGLKRKLGIKLARKLARKLATVATTTLSFLTVSTGNPAIAEAVNFDSRHLEKMLSVNIAPNQMGIISGDNLISLGGLKETQADEQTDNLKIAIPFGIAAVPNDSVDLEPLRNSLVDVNQPVALLKDPASAERVKYRGEYTDNPNFFETVIFSISLIGSVMTLTPIIIVKRQIKSYLE